MHISIIVDSNIMKKTGRILIASDLGAEYGFVDINGEICIYLICTQMIVSEK